MNKKVILNKFYFHGMRLSARSLADMRQNPEIVELINLAIPPATINPPIMERQTKIGQYYKDRLRAIFWHHTKIVQKQTLTVSV